MGYKSGFVTIIGSPNVGKSTLMNLMVGQKVSIVSDRAQTTRNKIMGVVSRRNYQIIFIVKNREGSANQFQIVVEHDMSRNIMKEVGITYVTQDF